MMTDIMKQVQIQNDHLIITLHNAVNPVIWQMDRARFRTAAFDIFQRQSSFFVRFKPLDGAVMDIAEYTDRAGALAVLKSIQSVLMDEPIGTSVKKYLYRGTSESWRQQMMLAVISVGLFVGLGMILFQLIPPPLGNNPTQITETQRSEPGIPQSADDVFKNQELR